DPERPGQSAAGIDGPVQGVGFVRRPVVRRAPGVVPAAACISTTGLRVTSPRRADSAFLSAAGRSTAATPGGQERRCPPYGSSAESTGDTLPSANVGRTALSCPPPGARPPPRPADKNDVVRPTGHQRSQPMTPCLPANVGRTALSCPPLGARP